MNNLIIGGLYTHFKSKDMVYKVIDIATHSETGDKLVVYQSQYDNKIWARPYDMFLDEVPKDKENPTNQTYRFELVK